MKKYILLIILFILLFDFTAAETIQFGSYWQNDSMKTPITWIILNETDIAYLLISECSLDANIFGHNNLYTTWESSIMRDFLNEYFYYEAFNDEEMKYILLSEIAPNLNIDYPKTEQGAITQDFVFLLSVEEVELYFQNENERISYATNFAKIGHTRIIGDNWAGVYTSALTNATCWRLRTMGKDNYSVCHVNENGTISYDGDILFAPHYAVRPCIWVLKEGVEDYGNKN